MIEFEELQYEGTIEEMHDRICRASGQGKDIVLISMSDIDSNCANSF